MKTLKQEQAEYAYYYSKKADKDAEKLYGCMVSIFLIGVATAVLWVLDKTNII